MRKITSKEIHERKTRRNHVIIAVLFVLLLVFSTLGFAFNGYLGTTDNGNVGNSGEAKSYGGFDFVNQNDLWITQIGNIFLAFVYFPDETPFVVTIEELKGFENYVNKDLYIYSEIYDAESELRRNVQTIVSNVSYGCLPEDKSSSFCKENAYEINCENEDINSIIIKQNQDSHYIEQKDNCAIIQTSNESAIGVVDEFIYKLYGIK